MNVSSVDLKKTVNLPKTSFKMKADLPSNEPKALEKWDQAGLYERIRESRAGLTQYVLHDGPPYANGNIHLGTAFNKILKDFIVKSKTMAGFDAPYIPGWDCHGLPIEFKVDQELGKRKASMSIAEIRARCRDYAAKFVDIHRREFKRLGVLGRWNDPYLTMSAEYEAVIAQAFVDFLHDGYIYKGLKPVHWCIKDRTALAEAEVEYENHTSPSIYVRFKLVSDPAPLDPALAGRDVYVLIWTTTPWTIPANLAISFNPKFEYVAVDTPQGVVIAAEGLLSKVAEALGWDQTVIARFPGSRLEGTVFRHPFIERDSLGLLGDHVTLDQGTGAVHTAPGHGQEDFVISQRYGIPVYCPIDASGRVFRAEGADGELPEELIGKTVWEINPIVIKLLEQHGALAGQARLGHSYPHCWRCHNPVIFRATEQWFIGIERNQLRAHALEAIKQVSWHPQWGEERMTNMIAMRPDWCISRQRVWGVPIIVFYCDRCATPFTERKVLERVVAQFREHTADVWYSKSVEELMGPGCACSNCGNATFRKESDILDVWFDSGSSHLATLTPANGVTWPSDMYVEGGDQYRGWFHSSLLIGVGLKNASPYRECATHGWTLDADGRAMSKSLGNIIEPSEIIQKKGADVLRLWVGSVDFTEDVRLSETILTRLEEAYKKIRNSGFRYMLSNLHDFDPSIDLVVADSLSGIDSWILVRAEDLIRRCRSWYDEYAFHKVYRAVYDFVVTDLSAIYFEVSRDQLYTGSHAARRRIQTALHRLNLALVRLLAPILSFTCEEVWQHVKTSGTKMSSVHVAYFPAPDELTDGLTDVQRAIASDWDKLVAVREKVLKALDTAREDKLIGSSLDAAVQLTASGELDALLRKYAIDLPAWFVVSQLELQVDPAATELRVGVERARGDKCERCWKYTTDVGSNPEFPTVCAACASVLPEHLS